MTSDPTPQAKAGGRRRYLSGESELRIRSYGFSHRIYESMVLGMHPEFAYPRRSRVAPPSGACSRRVSGPAGTIRESRTYIGIVAREGHGRGYLCPVHNSL